MAYKTIKVKKYSDNIVELTGSGAITPGMLVEESAADTCRAHNTAGGNAIPMFALEDELQGKTINENYASGNPVQVWIPAAGDEPFAILADGEDISINDPLESNGDGSLRKHDTEASGEDHPACIVAYALEAKDLSGSSGAESSGPLAYDKRILVRVAQ